METKKVIAHAFEPKYRRDNGLLVLDLDSVPLPSGFVLRERSLVRLPAGQIAGNHKHLRQEAYLCLGLGVQLHWIDEAEEAHVEQMHRPEGDPQLFVIPPLVPHAIINTSGHDAALLGYADGPLEHAEPVIVLSTETAGERLRRFDS